MRAVSIRPALNGYLCEVGCQMVVFTSRESLIQNLTEYLADPEAKEKAMIAAAVNPMGAVNPMAGPVDRQADEARARLAAELGTGGLSYTASAGTPR